MANANERVVNGVNTRVLHNKDYVEVAERVRIVHALEKKFEMVESAPYTVADRWLWKVVVRVDDTQHIGTAEVKLNAPQNTPDGTNPFECAETSALGRALGFAGLGTVQSIASYDEIARSQPFVATVEQVSTGVVDAPNAPKQIAPRQLTTQQASMKKHLEEFYALSPATYGKIPNWQELAIRAALDLAKEDVLPIDYTDDDVYRMGLYVAEKRREKQQKAS